jgi:Phosphotransferase enzyme family
MSVITIANPFQIGAEQSLPGLALALDPERARKELKRRLPGLSGEGKLRLKAGRVTRYKPGRRCVIEYDVEVDRPGTPRSVLTLIGKMRARRSGNEGFRLQEAFWNSGFGADSPDGISVPEPVGVISALQMWFQRKVPGTTAEALLAGPGGVDLARRVAEAAHKIHSTGVPTEKAHTIADELGILDRCLAEVGGLRTDWAGRVQVLMRRYREFAGNIVLPPPCGVHRDFYSAQVIVDGSRLWIIDFDLYCLGDAGVDPGNFIGHITEYALRSLGRADALTEVERALEDRFCDLAGEQHRQAVRAYTELTLGRHIFLSSKHPDRSHITESLLELCESRMGVRRGVRAGSAARR